MRPNPSGDSSNPSGTSSNPSLISSETESDIDDTTQVDINEGDILNIPTGNNTTREMVFIRWDSAGNCGIFLDKEKHTINRYDKVQTQLLVRIGEIRTVACRECDREAASVVLERAHRHHIKQLLDQRMLDADNAIDGSVVSAPVSEAAHNQTYRTCYAHACATAIRATEARIIGRIPEPFEKLVERIIAKLGAKTADVLPVFCGPKYLGCRPLTSTEQILASLQAGRVMVASFRLRRYEWHLFSAFFRKSPTGILSKKHFADFISNRWHDFPPELHKKSGHAVVIHSFQTNGNRVVFRMKNSWGSDFAHDGYFRVEADAFPDGRVNCTDVYFRVDMLPPVNIKRYIQFSLLRKTNIYRGKKSFKVEGCSSFFKIVESAEGAQISFNESEEKALEKIAAAFRLNGAVILERCGTIKVRDSSHLFRVAVFSRTKRHVINVQRELRRLS